MFKIIKTEYYDSFRCLMDKCKDNCCDENWIITIDDETYNRYKNLNIQDFDKKISSDTHTIIKENGKCPFILENGLCYWHKEFGEDYLSNTCKSYPRFVSSYGDLYVENIGLSCPASAQWIVYLDHKCEIVEKIYVEDQTEKSAEYKLLKSEILMRTVINILYKNTSFIEGVSELYQLFEANETVNFDAEIYSAFDLIFCNIGICFLFEHIMLETKKDIPDYVSVINSFCSIISTIASRYSEEESTYENKELLSDIIYKTMREMDHII